MRFSSQTLVGGHRGWPSRFPDNTLEGFEAAAQVADFVELDVRASADGRWVLAHDPVIGDRPVATTPWESLSTIDVGGGLHPTTLDDVFAALPALALDVEIKNSPGDPAFDPDHSVALAVAAAVRAIDVMTSFYWPTMDAVRTAFPEVKTGLLVDPAGSGLEALGVAADRGHQVVAPHWTLVDRELTEAARSAGIELVTWTVNDPAVALRLADEGVDAIITDDPGRLRQVLGERTES